jgi:hypothetical protein
MGHEFIGEIGWGQDPEADTLEMEIAIKYIKQSCGEPPRGVDVARTWQGYETSDGGESHYPVISVVWDDSVTGYPSTYIGKCIDAFERFELPKEIYERHQLLSELRQEVQELQERIAEASAKKSSKKP